MTRKSIIGFVNHKCIWEIITIKEMIKLLQQRIEPEKRLVKHFYQVRERHISNKEMYDYYTTLINSSEEFIDDQQRQIDNLIC